MEKLVLVVSLIVVSLSLSTSSVFAENIEWVRQFGTTSQDSVTWGVATDSSGNVYVGGYTEGTFPGEGKLPNTDSFISKYDSSGTQIWLDQFGTYGYDYTHAVSTDSLGNVYVGGFGPKNSGTGGGSFDATIRKYDSSGTEIWRRLSGTDSDDRSFSIATDSSGNVYVGGYTLGTFLGETSAGFYDSFISKYDSSGTQVWTRQFGTAGYDYVYGVSTDSLGNVYVSGYTDGAFPGETSAGNTDSFISKYDSSGNQIWTRQFGTADDDYAFGIATDSSGNVYVSGYTDGAFPGETSAGNIDSFISKYDSSGTQVWLHQFGTASVDFFNDLSTDSAGNVYVGGHTSGTFPGETSAGNIDSFISKYDSSGTQVWLHQFGTAGNDYAFGIATDSSGNVYVGGHTSGTFPGETGVGGDDAFVVKIVQNVSSEVKVENLHEFVTGLEIDEKDKDKLIKQIDKILEEIAKEHGHHACDDAQKFLKDAEKLGLDFEDDVNAICECLLQEAKTAAEDAISLCLDESEDCETANKELIKAQQEDDTVKKIEYYQNALKHAQKVLEE